MATWRLQWPHLHPGHITGRGIPSVTQPPAAHTGATHAVPVSIHVSALASASAGRANPYPHSPPCSTAPGVPTPHRAHGLRGSSCSGCTRRLPGAQAAGTWPPDSCTSARCRALSNQGATARGGATSRGAGGRGYTSCSPARQVQWQGEGAPQPRHWNRQREYSIVSVSAGAREGGVPSEEESEELAIALAVAASDTKAGDIRVLDVRPIVYWAQYFVIATAFSRPQMDALAKRLSDLAEIQYGRALRAGERKAPGPWTLMDYGDVVVHLFSPREREQYAIEGFYANAKDVSLPFLQEKGSQF